MSVTHVGGCDPGLVHTGVVSMMFEPITKAICIRHQAIAGPDTEAVSQWLSAMDHTFIEGYRPRAHFREDERMVKAVAELRKAMPKATVLDNTGIKKVVKQPVLELLGVWNFHTPTHHQDLRSAARIAVLGMLKDPVLNRLLADVVLDHLEGRTWHVAHG